MKKLIFAASAAMLVFAGCRVVEVENRGEAVVTDKDGNPVLVNGSPVKIKQGWNVYHNQHWMWTTLDSMEANVKEGEIAFKMGNLNSQPSSNLVALVDTSFTGASTLTTKIAAAIATCGGSAAGDGLVAIAQAVYSKFTGAGGDASKATVTTAADGTVTVTDGTVCTTCKDGVCTACGESATATTNATATVAK